MKNGEYFGDNLARLSAYCVFVAFIGANIE